MGVERRTRPERRSGERRHNGGGALHAADAHERRKESDRRSKIERRQQETPEEHIRNALQLLANLAAAEVLDDELRRDLDSAMFRLRFAVDRLESGT